MPRIRSLKPEIVSDVALASVSIEARYTFILLITQSDDIGLIGAAHRQLLGTLYPLDEAVSTPILLGWLEELVQAGLVRWLSTRDGVPVLQIVKWAKHQRIDNAGRSQIGALLANPPADLRPLLGIPTADVDNPVDNGSRTYAASRGGSPLGPTTTDLGSPSTDQGPPTVAEAAVRLVVRANQGLADHPSRSQADEPIVATNGTTHTATEAILAAGVPIAFAEDAIYRLASSHGATGKVRSLKYFTEAVIRAWTEHQEAARAKASPRPVELPAEPGRRGLAARNAVRDRQEEAEAHPQIVTQRWRDLEPLIERQGAQDWWEATKKAAVAAGEHPVLYGWEHRAEILERRVAAS